MSSLLFAVYRLGWGNALPGGGAGSFAGGRYLCGGSHPRGSSALSGLWGSLLAVSKVESSARGPRLPRFILLGRFSDTLLVVSILDICNCHL